MNIAEVIKRCAVDAVDAAVPCDLIFGEVLEIDPYRIKAGEMTLEGDILAVSESVEKKSCEISMGGYHKTVVINEGLEKGDSVALIRQSGGRGYIIIAKIGGG